MTPDTMLTSAEYVEKGVRTLIFTLQMAKKMLAVQWVLGNGLLVVMVGLLILLPFILKWKEGVGETIKEYPKEWIYLASRISQGTRVFLVKRWYVWYTIVITIGVIGFNVTPHLIPVPASAEFVFQHLR